MRLHTRIRTKVLLVYPKFPISFWGFQKAVEISGRKSAMPPTGLLTVAAMLPDDFLVTGLVDLNVQSLTDDQIDEADLILTSSMLVQSESLREVIKRVHSRGKKVVSGGPHPTLYPDDVPADYLVLGEAEVTLWPFLEDWRAGTPRAIYEESVWVQRMSPASLTREGKALIDRTPVPRWDLINLDDYASMAVQYSRGCPFSCDFCDIPGLYGRRTRAKSPEQMIREFNALYQAGWRGPVFIVDDNFIGNKSALRVFLPVLADWQRERSYPFSLFTEASADLGMLNHADIRDLMVDAGFAEIFIGLESSDPDVLKAMDKGQNLGSLSLAEKIAIIQESGLEVSGGIIIGHDGEKPNVFEVLPAFLLTTGVVMPMPGLLTAVRGTPLYQELKRAGRLRGESGGNNTHHLGFNFETELPEQFLIDGYVELLRHLFHSRNYYQRCRVLASRRGPYHRPSRLSWRNLAVAGRLLWRNLFRRPDIFFAHQLWWVLRRDPHGLAEFFAQAAKLLHFQKMTDDLVKTHRKR